MYACKASKFGHAKGMPSQVVFDTINDNVSSGVMSDVQPFHTYGPKALGEFLKIDSILLEFIMQTLQAGHRFPIGLRIRQYSSFRKHVRVARQSLCAAVNFPTSHFLAAGGSRHAVFSYGQISPLCAATWSPSRSLLDRAAPRGVV